MTGKLCVEQRRPALTVPTVHGMTMGGESVNAVHVTRCCSHVERRGASLVLEGEIAVKRRWKDAVPVGYPDVDVSSMVEEECES